MKRRDTPTVKPFPSSKQRRLDPLLEENSEGTVTTDERATLERLVAEAETLMVENVRCLADFAMREHGSSDKR